MTLPACVTRAPSVNQSHLLTQTVWSMRWQKGHSGWWCCVTSPLGVMHPASFLMTHTRIFDRSIAHKQKANANVFTVIPIWKTKQFIKLIIVWAAVWNWLRWFRSLQEVHLWFVRWIVALQADRWQIWEVIKWCPRMCNFAKFFAFPSSFFSLFLILASLNKTA